MATSPLQQYVGTGLAVRQSAKRLASVSTRGGSRGTYITFASAMRLRQPTLALKPRGDVTRNPKQGYQWPQKWTCVRQKLYKKRKKKDGGSYELRECKLLRSLLDPLNSCSLRKPVKMKIKETVKYTSNYYKKAKSSNLHLRMLR